VVDLYGLGFGFESDSDSEFPGAASFASLAKGAGFDFVALTSLV
jgi:hypothetical protein